ncbi:MAG TPA: cation diffusion facilitator family transporter [Bacteroidota bacterium]|nr:cation diffusion facilitator family transporter [Bacteroidota bacterium]
MDPISHRESEKTFVALSSIVAAIFVTSLKVVVGLKTGSLGILSEAAHSGLDLLAAIITFLAVRFSARPADRTHHYGHGKIENISALVETLFLLGTCAWIIREAFMRLMVRSVDVEVTFWSFFVIIVSIIVDASRSRALKRVAEKYRSQALEADALHFRTDVWSSGVVLLGLVLTLLRIPVADSCAALIVAAIVIFISASLGKRTIDELLDRAPAGIEDEIRRVAREMKGVQDVENVRVRNSGSKTFVDMILRLKRTLPFETANRLVHEAERAIQRILPEADVVIHPEPTETADETIADKVKLMMASAGLTAHDVRAFEVNGRYQVEFQLEFEEHEDFVRVHRTVDEIEQRIKHDIPNVGAVIVHIEDSPGNVVETVDVTDRSHEVVEEIMRLARSTDGVLDCSVVSVLEAKGRYRVALKCLVDQKLSLEEVHSISTALENRIMVALPIIKETNIHAEPAAV